MFKGRLRVGLRAFVIAVSLVAGYAGSYGAVLLATGNIHTVVDGVLYRSAQLTRGQFETVIRQYGIKSILNLRGGQPADSWYADEIAVSRELGVAHFDYPISARRHVTREQITDIVAILRSAPKPLLIHCRSGADRTGLGAALFLLDVEHADPAVADRQLSPVYGHFPYLLSKTVAMDDSFWDFVGQTASLNVPGH